MDFIKIPETLKYVFFLHFELFRFGLFPVLAVLTNIYILNVQKYMNKIILYLFILSLSLSLSLSINSIQFNSIQYVLYLHDNCYNVLPKFTPNQEEMCI